jgi:hypothetical protein
MKQRNIIIFVVFLLASITAEGQSYRKRCKTCRKYIQECEYQGVHPLRQNANMGTPSYTPNRVKPQSQYIERTETRKPGETYDFVGEYSSLDIAWVKLRGKYGFINKDEKEVVPLKYDNISCGLYPDRYTLWTKSMKLFSVSQNWKWGYINQQGHLSIPMIYSKVDPYVYEDDNSIWVQKDGKYGTITQNGDIVIPIVYDELGHFYNGHPAYAKRNGWYGYIDEKNNTVIPFKYSTAATFDDKGTAPVSLNGKYGYVDVEGNEVIPLKYEFAGSFGSCNLAGVVSNAKLGFIDRRGNVIIPFQYDIEYDGEGDKKDLRGGFLGPVATVLKGGKWGMIDTTGNLVAPFIYDYCLMESSNGDRDMKKGHKTVYLDKGGNEYASERERSDSSTIRLARQGYAKEQSIIGENYYRGRAGYVQDYGQAFYWFRKAGEQSNAHACYFLGWMYEFGQGVEQNYLLAKEWYDKAAQQEHAGSLLRLGHLYYYGRGVSKNYNLAFPFYEKSALYKDKEALYYLGWLYEHGQGCTKDMQKAIECYIASSDAGYEEAKKRLVVLGVK